MSVGQEIFGSDVLHLLGCGTSRQQYHGPVESSGFLQISVGWDGLQLCAVTGQGQSCREGQLRDTAQWVQVSATAPLKCTI